MIFFYCISIAFVMIYAGCRYLRFFFFTVTIIIAIIFIFLICSFQTIFCHDIFNTSSPAIIISPVIIPIFIITDVPSVAAIDVYIKPMVFVNIIIYFYFSADRNFEYNKQLLVPEFFRFAYSKTTC